MGLKFALLLLASFLVCSSSASIVKDALLNPKGFAYKPDHPFGLEHFERVTPQGRHTILVSSGERDLLAFLNSNSTARKDTLNFDEITINCSAGDAPDYFKFFPTLKGTVRPNQNQLSFTGNCFKEHNISVSISGNQATLRHSTSQADSWLCSEFYLLATPTQFHVEYLFFQGDHVTEFRNLSETEIAEISRNGIRIITFCDYLNNLLPDILKTAAMFLGAFNVNPNIPFLDAKPAPWQEYATVDFLHKALGYKYQRREKNKRIDLDENLIRSGDMVGVTRFDGGTKFVEWGTGGRLTHVAVAFWIDGELYVLESQTVSYWPKQGIQRNRFKDWVDIAESVGYNVVILPLSDEARARFDEKKALEWFESVEGSPYGSHNFFFGWMDTPYDNAPDILNMDLLPVGLAIYDKLDPKTVAINFGEALNKRLGTTNLSVVEMLDEINRRNLTFLEVGAQVEKEGELYSDGLSYVCSAFVTAVYKRAGLFWEFEIESTEFVPRDLYILNFFNKTPTLPLACVDNDPGLPYCQILGNWRIELDEYSTLAPYNHMNERCPSKAPDFKRTENC